MILVTAEQMREADRRTIEEVGLPGAVLMENAAQGAVRMLKEAVGEPAGLDVAAFCGRGNNGGDGLAMLRILANQGALTVAYLLCPKDDLRGDAAMNLAVAQACGVEVVEVLDEEAFDLLHREMTGHDVYLDALLGTGLNSEPRGRYGLAIELLNSLEALVMAVDIPSGLSADTGCPLGLAVHADLTATFGLIKIGLALEPGEYVGELGLVDISIPPVVAGELGASAALIEPELARELMPMRPTGGHKGTFGHLLVVGGSPGKSGAPCLAAWGGLRCGAGLVTVGLPMSLNPIAEAKLTTAMSLPLPQTIDGGLAFEGLETVAAAAVERSAMVLGPGLGTDEESRELARGLARMIEGPLLIDADGLGALGPSGSTDYGFDAGRVVLTPHPGEAARMLGCSVAEVQEDRAAAARVLAKETKATVVLKGARSLVALPSGDLWVNQTGNVLLAGGGSGDVLAGVIGGLMAQGLDAPEASLLGVLVHGLAADLAVEDFGDRGMAAEELADYLPAAFGLLLNGPQVDDEHEH